MIGVFYHHDSVFSRCGGNYALQFVGRAINVVRTEHKQFRLCTMCQIRKVSMVHWRSEADQLCDPRILATGAKSHPATETESRNEQRNIWKFGSKKIERRADIASLAFAAIVLPFAQTRSAKIETQDRKSKRIQGF